MHLWLLQASTVRVITIIKGKYLCTEATNRITQRALEHAHARPSGSDKYNRIIPFSFVLDPPVICTLYNIYSVPSCFGHLISNHLFWLCQIHVYYWTIESALVLDNCQRTNVYSAWQATGSYTDNGQSLQVHVHRHVGVWLINHVHVRVVSLLITEQIES